MEYELTIKLVVKSRFEADRVMSQTEAVCEFGTVREAIAVGLRLDEDPHLAGVSVRETPAGVPSSGAGRSSSARQDRNPSWP